MISSNPQTTRHLFMVEPAEFDYNPSTAPSNPYQINDDKDRRIILERAIAECRSFHALLIENGVHVTMAKGIAGCPDHIFPNWFSTHEGREMIIYPMLTPNRAAEKTPDMLETLKRHYNVRFDWSAYEAQGLCLEGLSSLILDRVNRVAYGTLSARTEGTLAQKWCDEMGYEAVLFKTASHTGAPVYHSDVLMHIGTGFAGICTACIHAEDRARVIDRLSGSGRAIIDLSMEQMRAFAGNALEVQGEGGRPLIVMAQSGWDSLDQRQKDMYLGHVDAAVTPALPTIQRYGGGAARCMLQELF